MAACAAGAAASAAESAPSLACNASAAVAVPAAQAPEALCDMASADAVAEVCIAHHTASPCDCGTTCDASRRGTCFLPCGYGFILGKHLLHVHYDVGTKMPPRMQICSPETCAAGTAAETSRHWTACSSACNGTRRSSDGPAASGSPAAYTGAFVASSEACNVGMHCVNPSVITTSQNRPAGYSPGICSGYGCSTDEEVHPTCR